MIILISTKLNTHKFKNFNDIDILFGTLVRLPKKNEIRKTFNKIIKMKKTESIF